MFFGPVARKKLNLVKPNQAYESLLKPSNILGVLRLLLFKPGPSSRHHPSTLSLSNQLEPSQAISTYLEFAFFCHRPSAHHPLVAPRLRRPAILLRSLGLLLSPVFMILPQ